MSNSENKNTSSKNKKGKILVVDDDLKNRKILKDVLEINNFEVLEAENGIEALEVIYENKPDVILLDIMMPRMNGFEVCRRIKKDPELSYIPVIMITALTDRDSRLRGISEGANDFISKPIDLKEVLLRVNNAVETKKLYDDLKHAYKKLKELEELRDNLVHMIVHDMRQPVTALSGYLQILNTHSANCPDIDKKIIDESYGVTQILIEMISSLLDVSKFEEGKMKINKTQCNLSELVEEAVHTFDILKSNRKIEVINSEEDVTCMCDEELIKRVLINLIGNAVKFTPDGGNIQITLSTLESPCNEIARESVASNHVSKFSLNSSPSGIGPFKKKEEQLTRGKPKVKNQGSSSLDFVKVSVKDNGPGIPSEYHNKIFEKFGQVETRKGGKKYSTGLGLTFCKLVIEAHGGKIDIESQPGRGSTFWFTLPKN